MFALNHSFYPKKAFQPSGMFTSKAGAHLNRLERLPKDKRSSLLRTFIICGTEKFNSIWVMGPML